MHRLERYRGSLLGLAVGDALGTTLEFREPGSFEPICDMVGGGPFGLAPGEWTDDTSMALCLAESLCKVEAFNLGHQMRAYRRWFRFGHMSCKPPGMVRDGRRFDVGITIRRAIWRYEESGDACAGPTDAMAAGNGSAMRLAPVPLLFARRPGEAVEKSGESSKATHGAREAVDACRYLGALLVGAVNGVEKEDLLADRFSPAGDRWEAAPLAPKIAGIASGSFKRRDPPEIRGGGYVVDSLEAALWAFHRSASFREGALLAVNLGDDADTTGAIYGQLAGAFYGEFGIPGGWVEKLARRELIESLAERLFALAESVGHR